MPLLPEPKECPPMQAPSPKLPTILCNCGPKLATIAVAPEPALSPQERREPFALSPIARFARSHFQQFCCGRYSVPQSVLSCSCESLRVARRCQGLSRFYKASRRRWHLNPALDDDKASKKLRWPHLQPARDPQ